jgi:hypothetical protein
MDSALVQDQTIANGKRYFLHPPGIEPRATAWKAVMLTLHHRCLHLMPGLACTKLLTIIHYLHLTLHQPFWPVSLLRSKFLNCASTLSICRYVGNAEYTKSIVGLFLVLTVAVCGPSYSGR